MSILSLFGDNNNEDAASKGSSVSLIESTESFVDDFCVGLERELMNGKDDDDDIVPMLKDDKSNNNLLQDNTSIPLTTDGEETETYFDSLESYSLVSNKSFEKKAAFSDEGTTTTATTAISTPAAMVQVVVDVCSNSFDNEIELIEKTTTVESTNGQDDERTSPHDFAEQDDIFTDTEEDADPFLNQDIEVKGTNHNNTSENLSICSLLDRENESQEMSPSIESRSTAFTNTIVDCEQQQSDTSAPLKRSTTEIVDTDTTGLSQTYLVSVVSSLSQTHLISVVSKTHCDDRDSSQNSFDSAIPNDTSTGSSMLQDLSRVDDKDEDVIEDKDNVIEVHIRENKKKKHYWKSKLASFATKKTTIGSNLCIEIGESQSVSGKSECHTEESNTVAPLNSKEENCPPSEPLMPKKARNTIKKWFKSRRRQSAMPVSKRLLTKTEQSIQKLRRLVPRKRPHTKAIEEMLKHRKAALIWSQSGIRSQTSNPQQVSLLSNVQSTHDGYNSYDSNDNSISLTESKISSFFDLDLLVHEDVTFSGFATTHSRDTITTTSSAKNAKIDIRVGSAVDENSHGGATEKPQRWSSLKSFQKTRKGVSRVLRKGIKTVSKSIVRLRNRMKYQPAK